MDSTGPAPARLRCRQIEAADLGSIGGLLAVGFPRRSHRRWAELLMRLVRQPSLEGFPRFGYMLEAEQLAVGVLLLICSQTEQGGVRCNVSSWYVDPAYRTYAPLLMRQAYKFKNATYLNLSPSDEVIPIVTSQGFGRLADGTFAAIIAASRGSERARVLNLGEEAAALELSAWERQLLRDHHRFGCVTICVQAAGAISPFVFRRRFVTFHSKRPWVPCAQLIYCRGLDELVRFAGPLGRFLGLRGIPFVMTAADGPITGLKGKYFSGQTPMYYRGPERPRLGDLAYTEAAVFGY